MVTVDPDGNLTSDGRFTYTWDGENRLVSVESISTVLPANRVKVTFAYDYMSRRVSKTVYHWDTNTNAYSLSPVASYKFAWDGWNLIATFDGSNNLKHSYTWGEGGLISDTDVANSNTYFPFYDGNMNVMGYVDSTGAKVAEYEYDIFGRLTVKSGPKADDFNIRFSSYFFDKETGLVYYGYRYLNPDTGRWINRDPIQEQGGINIYGFVGNDGINKTDYLGLDSDGRNYVGEVYEALVKHCPKGNSKSCCEEKQCKFEAAQIAKAYVQTVMAARQGVISSWGSITSGNDGNADAHVYGILRGSNIDLESLSIFKLISIWSVAFIQSGGTAVIGAAELASRVSRIAGNRQSPVPPAYLCYEWRDRVKLSVNNVLKGPPNSKCFRGEDREINFPVLNFGHYVFGIQYIGNTSPQHIADLDPWPNALPELR